MTLNEFGRFLNTKSVGRVEAPINEQMTERVYTAMKKIGKDTFPLKWIVNTSEGIQVLRRIDSETFVRMPIKPVLDSGEQLDIEEELIDALSYYVMAGLELQRSKINMGLYWSEIEQNNERLSETYLAEATNDAPRFHVFP